MIFVLTLTVFYLFCLSMIFLFVLRNTRMHIRLNLSRVRLKIGKILAIKNGKVYMEGKEETNSSKIGLKLLQYADSTIADTKIINSFDDL